MCCSSKDSLGRDVLEWSFSDVLDHFKSFLASGDFCCLLITFANRLDPVQDRQNVGPDLDPNGLTLLR